MTTLTPALPTPMPPVAHVPPVARLDGDGFEVRLAPGLRPLTVRAAGAGEPIPFEGYAAVFNSRSVDLGGYFEIIAPGAFTVALTRDDVRFTLNHNPNFVLARHRNEAGDTLELEEDAVGLRVAAMMAPTSYAQDLATVVRRGDVSQMSFRFRTLRDDWRVLGGGMLERTLFEVELEDVSVVTYPAYPQTTASVRAQGLAGLARALGIEDLDDERRDAAMAVLARGGEPADVLAGVRAITQRETPISGTPNRDGYARRMAALATFRRLPLAPVPGGGNP